MLGICRGIQFFNACLGGTLYQDLPTEHPSEVAHVMRPPYDQTVHSVALLPGTPLAALLGRAELGVNSYHHQAIKVLAPGLVEMARSEDGLVEAVYLPDKSFVWAVQWHPEFSFRTDENSRKIFSAFVAAASKFKRLTKDHSLIRISCFRSPAPPGALCWPPVCSYQRHEYRYPAW